MFVDSIHTVASLIIIGAIGYGFYVMMVADEESREREAGHSLETE